MDDQFNDDATCGSIDSTSHGINITPRVNYFFSQKTKLKIKIIFFSYQQQ